MSLETLALIFFSIIGVIGARTIGRYVRNKSFKVIGIFLVMVGYGTFLWSMYGGIVRRVGFTNSIGMKLVLIPAGKFIMGSSEKDGSGFSQGPEHLVEITRPFFLGVYEVTQEEYNKVMGTNPSYYSPISEGKEKADLKKLKGLDTRRFPVEQVSWEDAVEFCRKLSSLPEEKAKGRIFRLPTEAEWEYACRAGTTTAFHFGDSLFPTQANFCPNPFGRTPNSLGLGLPTVVGSYQPNAFGLYDMHGNVSEWCADWYDPEYYKHSPKSDPPGPASSPNFFRVIRGGFLTNVAQVCTSACRRGYLPTEKYCGFRVACSLSPRNP